MAKQHVVLTAVFFLTLGLSLWILAPELFDFSASVEGPGSNQERTQGDFRRNPDSRPGRTSGNPEAVPNSSGAGTANDGPEAPEHGRLTGVVQDEYGNPIGPAAIGIVPFRGRVLTSDGGRFEIADLPPGPYSVTVHVHGYLAARLGAIKVAAGKTTEVEASLRKGLVPAGECFGQRSLLPVAGATVTFASGLQLRTDEQGRFESPVAIEPAALQEITVSHPEYDTTVLRNQPFEDPGRLRLALSRGDSTLYVSLSNELPKGEEMPGRAVLTLRLRHGGTQRYEERRRLQIAPARETPIKHLHQGEWQARFEFPDTTIPPLVATVHIPAEGQALLKLPLRKGITLSGTLTHQHRRPAGVTVELRDALNLVLTKTVSDEQGNFAFKQLQPGRYRLRVLYHQGGADTRLFDVGPLDNIEFSVNAMNGSLQK